VVLIFELACIALCALANVRKGSFTVPALLSSPLVDT
jgi:hypothetical protein